MPSIPIIMPQLGESIAEATIINFLIPVGDQVQADQDIIEVETNKATMNVTAPCPGRVEKFLVNLNESYAVGAVLGYLQASTEDALARLGKVLNWLGLTVGFVSGAWVLICLATLLGAFGSYTDTFGTALLAAAGVVVGFLGWLAGRTALYVLAGR